MGVGGSSSGVLWNYVNVPPWRIRANALPGSYYSIRSILKPASMSLILVPQVARNTNDQLYRLQVRNTRLSTWLSWRTSGQVTFQHKCMRQSNQSIMLLSSYPDFVFRASRLLSSSDSWAIPPAIVNDSDAEQNLFLWYFNMYLETYYPVYISSSLGSISDSHGQNMITTTPGIACWK